MFFVKQKERSAKTINKLIDTGYRLFAQKGFVATSINDIVREAGYSKGAFYAHFASKEEFLVQVITERVRGYFQKLRRAMAEDSDNMLRLFAEYSIQLTEQAREEALSPVLFELVVAANRYPNVKQLLIEVFEDWRSSLAEYIELMQKKELIRCRLDARILANTAISLFHGFLLQHHLDERVPYLSFVESFLQLLDPVEPIHLSLEGDNKLVIR